MFHTAIAEVTQKRVSCSEWKKSESREFLPDGLRKQAVHQFVRSAISADSNKVPHTARVGIASNFRRLSRRARRGDLHLDACLRQALES